MRALGVAFAVPSLAVLSPWALASLKATELRPCAALEFWRLGNPAIGQFDVSPSEGREVISRRIALLRL